MLLIKHAVRFFVSIAIFCFVHLEAVHIGLITSKYYVGDREAAWRIKIAGERMGWQVSIDEMEGQKIIDEKFDWTICMLPENNFSNPHSPTYLMVFHPLNYLDEQRRFLPFYEKYDGYLLTIHDRESLKSSLELHNRPFHHIPFYPTVYSTPYHETVPHELVILIPTWSNRIMDTKFRTLYKSLSRSGLAKFYGIKPTSHLVPKGYLGTIPFDGISVIDVLQKHGIVLVIHSDIHNADQIPTSRIFEAAAASAIVISDQNAFVKKYFADSVFYIDTDLSADNILSQIMEHLDNIREHPQMALDMAKQAHQIFIDNFTMEQQLLSLEALHQEVMLQRR